MSDKQPHKHDHEQRALTIDEAFRRNLPSIHANPSNPVYAMTREFFATSINAMMDVGDAYNVAKRDGKKEFAISTHDANVLFGICERFFGMDYNGGASHV